MRERGYFSLAKDKARYGDVYGVVAWCNNSSPKILNAGQKQNKARYHITSSSSEPLRDRYPPPYR